MRTRYIIIISILLIQQNISGQVVKDSLTNVYAGAILKVGITTASGMATVLTTPPTELLSKGVCWNSKPNPGLNGKMKIIKSDSSVFIWTLHNLHPDSLYFLRVFTVTRNDTIYSDNKIFFTHREDAVKDIDDNFYNTVKIGNQVWLAEDLKTARLNDGSAIIFARDNPGWIGSVVPMYSYYGNDSVNYSFPRGKLYNWYAVNTNRLCPSGWHVPSNEEWKQLSATLGGDTIAGGKLKTPGTMIWHYPNNKATNESGFSAFPAGFRKSNGDWFFADYFTYWWSTGFSDSFPISWYVYHATGKLYHQSISKDYGYCVRCIRDK
jgi:uncharacterized protein (TIGR02145 family)